LAKISDTDLVWFGDSTNKDQMTLGIPGGPAANTGGLIFLETINSSAAPADGLYLFTDGTSLRYSTSRPSNTNTGGNALDNTTIGAACNKALSNLASVAVNTNIVSDTDSTDDLGSSSIYWANAYLDKVLFNSTATMEGTTGAGIITIVGDIVGGASGTGSAFQFFATTAGGYLKWDDTANTNAGGLIFTDDAQAIFGDASDFTVQKQTILVLFKSVALKTQMLHFMVLLLGQTLHGMPRLTRGHS
jgi:hypothetical protein